MSWRIYEAYIIPESKLFAWINGVRLKALRKWQRRCLEILSATAIMMKATAIMEHVFQWK